MYDINGIRVVAEAGFWQSVREVFTTPSLTLFLLLGSLVLIVSLMLLTLTRLGHARPITKCVVLSVIAHILLLGYAYGTRMMLQVPVAKEEPVKVNLVAGDEEDDPQPRVVTKKEGNDDPSVSNFVADHISPDTVDLNRPEIDSPFELERTVEFDANQMSIENRVSIAELTDVRPQYNRRAEDIHFPSAMEVESANNVDPQAIEFQRRGEVDGDPRHFDPSFEPDVKLEVFSEIKEVEVSPNILEQAEIQKKLSTPEDFISDFEVPNSESELTDDLLADDSFIAKRNEPREYGTGKSMVMEEVRRLGDGRQMPQTFLSRASKANRQKAIASSGGSQGTEDAVAAGLSWLAKTQSTDGHWEPLEFGAGVESKVFGHDRGGCGAQSQTGITALATLAFLGAGHTHLEGDYKTTVQKALEFLIRQQANNGDFSGNAKLFARMYCHSMSLLAISEALAMTGDQRLQRAVHRGVGFTVQAQDKKGGGWRYQPGDTGDMSQFGWNVMALNIAQLGGVEIQEATNSRMVAFLKSCQTGTAKGLASYRPGEGPSTTMTAEALVCKLFLNLPIEKDSLKETKQRILEELPSFDRTNFYYWYYATIALRRLNDDAWLTWNGELQRVLLSQQIRSGELAGSWAPTGKWSGYGGRIYSTALATLCLEVYYRYQDSPLVQSAQSESLELESAEFEREIVIE
ncbi:MAG: prenyltransferase/squalene oxidase repeat-containing protein [Planctomycetota bacterium]